MKPLVALLFASLAYAWPALGASLNASTDMLCLDQIEAGINPITPPEYLKNLPTVLHWMNPHLEGEPLVNMLNKKGVNFAMISSSQVTFHQYRKLVDACHELRREISIVSGDMREQCSGKIASLLDTSASLYAQYAETNPALIEKLATDKVCLLIERRLK